MYVLQIPLAKKNKRKKHLPKRKKKEIIPQLKVFLFDQILIVEVHEFHFDD